MFINTRRLRLTKYHILKEKKYCTGNHLLSYLLAVLIVKDSQHKYIDERDKECGVCVELLLLHEHICSVTEVKIAHDDAHPAKSLERCLWTQGYSCSCWLLLF